MRQRKRVETQLIIGMGEIGEPIYKILSDIYEVDAYDQKYVELRQDQYDIVHVCFGHREGEEADFIKWVKGYQERFLKPGGLTIIHSTVSIGVSKELSAVHSPVRGMHPRMEAGIREFTKFFGGDRADEAAEIFRRAGLKVYIFDKSETTELGKISETTFYALMIEYVKELKRECDERGLSFGEVYTLQAQEYNAGWERLGHPEYTMPLLVPMMFPQRGHCTIPNAHLWKTPFTKLILEQNENAQQTNN